MTQSSGIVSKGRGTSAWIATAVVAGLIGMTLAHGAAWGATLGMVANEGSDTVTVFDADSHAVLVSLPIGPSNVIGDCVVNPEGTRGLVTDFSANLWVVDLTTMPPTLAGGTNPIPMSNSAGEDVALTADGAYAVVCDGSGLTPVSVVSVASQTEVDSLNLGHDCNSVDVCDDGSVLVTSVDGGTATLTPSHWFKGARAGTVEVDVPPEVQTALVGAPQFELGKRYLVAGGDGQVGLCGMSGEYSPELEALYRSAFAS